MVVVASIRTASAILFRKDCIVVTLISGITGESACSRRFRGTPASVVAGTMQEANVVCAKLIAFLYGNILISGHMTRAVTVVHFDVAVVCVMRMKVPLRALRAGDLSKGGGLR